MEAAQPEAPGGGPAKAGSAPGAPAGYDVLAERGAGRTLFAVKPGISSAKAGALAALRDLRAVFDDKPAVSGAFADDTDKRCQAAFTAKLKGESFQGTLFCGVGNTGAALSVIYARAGAPAAELAALRAALPNPTQWVTHPLQAGSGTIQLPADWKLTSSTALGSASVTGPAGQLVGLGIGAQVVTPDSFLARQARATGTLLVAPYSDPVTALKNLVPQLSALSQRQGGPAVLLEQIISNAPAPAQLPNGRASWIYSRYTRGSGAGAIKYRELALLECYPLGAQGWGLHTSYIAAPETIFERDQPLMLQIAQGWKLNSQTVQDNSRQMIAAQNQRFAAYQQSMKERNAAFDGYLQSLRNNERIRDKCNADFVEVIRGYRTVEDTTTGYRKDVDLGYSKEIVDKLNEKEGYNRYREIPLRDQ